MSEDPALNYSTYLRIGELLELQQPLSDGPEHDEIRYLGEAFANTSIDKFEVTRVTFKWKTMWEKGQAPY